MVSKRNDQCIEQVQFSASHLSRMEKREHGEEGSRSAFGRTRRAQGPKRCIDDNFFCPRRRLQTCQTWVLECQTLQGMEGRWDSILLKKQQDRTHPTH